jgi:hypothetical protein
LEDNEIEPYDGKIELEEYVMKHKEAIYKKVGEYRSGYLKYFDSLNIKKDDRLLFFDFVSSGTCQMYLNKLLNKKLEGLYFVRISDEYNAKKELVINPMFENRSIYDKQRYLSNLYIFLESIFTSYDPTLECFDSRGKACYLEESRTEKDVDDIKNIHKGIIRYFNDFIRNMGNFPDEEIDISLPDRILGIIQENECIFEEDIIRGKKLEDEFCNRCFKCEECI